MLGWDAQRVHCNPHVRVSVLPFHYAFRVVSVRLPLFFRLLRVVAFAAAFVV